MHPKNNVGFLAATKEPNMAELFHCLRVTYFIYFLRQPSFSLGLWHYIIYLNQVNQQLHLFSFGWGWGMKSTMLHTTQTTPIVIYHKELGLGYIC